MKHELRDLHAQHETDASLIIEWQETSNNLERQCLQQQAELQSLRGLISGIKKQDASSKQKWSAHR